MLFRKDVLNRIATGEITLAFRKWRRPTVTTGGQLKTAIGVLAIHTVEIVDANKIKAADAHRAGYTSCGALLGELAARSGGAVYRIAFEHVGDDPRVTLRQESRLKPDDIENIGVRLARFDLASPNGAWTRATLETIAKKPGKRAADLASDVGLDTPTFKRYVRKLKDLGLTESLGTGYRLSPRGTAYMAVRPPKRRRAVRAVGSATTRRQRRAASTRS